MEIRAEEITRILREQLGEFEAGIDVAEVGTVLTVGDGIARLSGLERCMAGELAEVGLRDAEVIPPWVEVTAAREEAGSYLLLAGRLVPRKRKYMSLSALNLYT